MVEAEPWPIQALPFLGFREPFSALSHLIGAAVAAYLGAFLVLRSRSAWAWVGLSVFVGSAVFLLSMSGTYHLLAEGGGRAVLKRLDASGVYVLIAGTMTPIVLILLRGAQRIAFIAVVWSFVGTFVPLRVVFFQLTEGVPGGLAPLILGWTGLALGWVLIKRWGFAAVKRLLWGGIAYTAGISLIPNTWIVVIPGVIGAHELWHIAVVVGLVFHWSYIQQIAMLRPEDVVASGDWADLMARARRAPPTLGPREGGRRAWWATVRGLGVASAWTVALGRRAGSGAAEGGALGTTADEEA